MSTDTSNVTIHTPNDFITMPWRNGLGSTIELLKHQPDDSFTWRLSMADVTQDGAFSDFSGYDRCLILVSGNGITLSDDQGQSWPLEKQLDVAHFKGEDLVNAELHNGPIRDFNLMTKRQNCIATLVTSQQQNQQQIALNGDVFLLFNVQGETSFALDGQPLQELAEQHLMQLDPSAISHCYCTGDAWAGILITYI